MAKILGNYIIRARALDFVGSFEFTGANRDSRLTLDENKMLSFECTDITRPANNEVSFNSDAVLKIRGIRILTTGAEGLRGGLGDKAANLLFQCRKLDDVTSPIIGAFQVLVDKFNEWNPVNIDLVPGLTANKNYFIGLNSQYSFLSVDDFNIQDDYLGQSLVPYIELKIDTAGIYDYSGELV